MFVFSAGGCSAAGALEHKHHASGAEGSEKIWSELMSSVFMFSGTGQRCGPPAVARPSPLSAGWLLAHVVKPFSQMHTALCTAPSTHATPCLQVASLPVKPPSHPALNP